MAMTEIQMDETCEELFEPVQEFLVEYSLDEALAIAEVFQSKVDGYVAGLRDDVRRRDS